MISGLLDQLQSQYSLANAPNPAPAAGDPNGLSGLLQTTGIPQVSNPVGQRTPDYMSLLGMLGQQPFTPGYTGIGGAAGGGGQSDYLDRVLGGGDGGGSGEAQVGTPGVMRNYYSGGQYGDLQADLVNMYMSMNNGQTPPWATYDYLTGGGGG